MGTELTNNAIWVAVGSMITAIIAYLRSGRDSQEKRIDGLLMKQGEMQQQLQTMALKMGTLEGEVRALTDHRNELAALTVKQAATITAQLITMAEKDKTITDLIATNAELYKDLEAVQAEVTELKKKYEPDKLVEQSAETQSKNT